MKVLLERFPYRYVESGTLENGMPDYRSQKLHLIIKEIHVTVSLGIVMCFLNAIVWHTIF